MKQIPLFLAVTVAAMSAQAQTPSVKAYSYPGKGTLIDSGNVQVNNT